MQDVPDPFVVAVVTVALLISLAIYVRDYRDPEKRRDMGLTREQRRRRRDEESGLAERWERDYQEKLAKERRDELPPTHTER